MYGLKITVRVGWVLNTDHELTDSSRPGTEPPWGFLQVKSYQRHTNWCYSDYPASPGVIGLVLGLVGLAAQESVSADLSPRYTSTLLGCLATNKHTISIFLHQISLKRKPLSHSSLGKTSPSDNCTGWLGIKH